MRRADGAASVEFRALGEGDLPLLHDWLGRPHVAEWWGSPPDIDDVRDEYLAAKAYLAWSGDQAIGFVQSYVAADAGDGWWPDEQDRGVVGIDVFLADATQLDKSYGSAMVMAFVAFLFRDPAVTRIIVDPKPTNGRAMRCFEKAGFNPEHTINTPDGAALLMQLDRTPAYGVGAAGAPRG